MDTFPSYDRTSVLNELIEDNYTFPFSAARVIWCAYCCITCSLFCNVYSFFHITFMFFAIGWSYYLMTFCSFGNSFHPFLPENYVCRITQWESSEYTMEYRFFESPAGTEMGSKNRKVRKIEGKFLPIFLLREQIQ